MGKDETVEVGVKDMSVYASTGLPWVKNFITKTSFTDLADQPEHIQTLVEALLRVVVLGVIEDNGWKPEEIPPEQGDQIVTHVMLEMVNGAVTLHNRALLEKIEAEGS